MSESSQPSEPRGRSRGYVDTGVTAEDIRMDVAAGDLIDHNTGCKVCGTAGVDCEEAAALREIYRKAKAAAQG